MTNTQITSLFNAAQEREYQDMLFTAALHGVDLKDSKSKPKETKQSEQTSLPFVFDAPENYKKMSPEEREQATDEMMKRMKHFANNKRMV